MLSLGIRPTFLRVRVISSPARTVNSVTENRMWSLPRISISVAGSGGATSRVEQAVSRNAVSRPTSRADPDTRGFAVIVTILALDRSSLECLMPDRKINKQ